MEKRKWWWNRIVLILWFIFLIIVVKEGGRGNFYPCVLLLISTMVFIFLGRYRRKENGRKSCDYCDNKGFLMAGNIKIPCPKCGNKREARLMTREVFKNIDSEL